VLRIPHHITGFWRPYYSVDPLRTGSIGAGLLVDEAVVKFTEADGVYYNGELVAPNGGVEVQSPYPLGYGYAASAVFNIARAVRRLGLGIEAFIEAHVREVEAGTGLGDVLAIYTGGCLVVRTRPGAPGVGSAYSISCPPLALVTVDLLKVHTGAMLERLREFLQGEGARLVEKFMEEVDVLKFLEIANEFSKRAGFMPKWAEDVNKLRGVVGCFAKKGVVAVVVEMDFALDVADRLAKYGVVHVVELRDRRVSLI